MRRQRRLWEAPGGGGDADGVEALGGDSGVGVVEALGAAAARPSGSP